VPVRAAASVAGVDEVLGVDVVLGVKVGLLGDVAVGDVVPPEELLQPTASAIGNATTTSMSTVRFPRDAIVTTA
jgi:hypothetical protein